MLNPQPQYRLKVSLLDGDTQRRGRISFHLAGAGLHVEPFETAEELAARPPSAGVILVHDHESLLVQALLLSRRADCQVPVVVFGEAPVSEIVAIVRRGAVDYVCWTGEPDDLVTPLHSAVRSGPGPRLALVSGGGNRLDRLTRREREVLEAAAGGLSSRLTGERLAISPRTVEVHRANVLKKMGVREMSEAIRLRMELG